MTSELARAMAAGMVFMAATQGGSGREIHVAKSGLDDGVGGREQPYLTIGRAAAVAQPGDVVTVHAGVYREWVRPVQGGSAEDARIVYRAAPGDKVSIRGSERITTWTRENDAVWKVELPESFFEGYNPYALKVSGGWLNYGKWHHRGDVYLDGEAFLESETAAEVLRGERSWHCEVKGDTTTIRANFGDADPNKALVEINVRESLFFPDVSGLKFITVDGFHFAHAAANWAPPVLDLQTGAVGPRMGKHWIIQNCTVEHARCVGIILGQAPGVDYGDIDAFGAHIVRNNVIRRCGQAGIAGQKGATRSLISGNFIEDTNYRREFGGWETAAIKFHNTVDTVVSHNLIRGVHHQMQGAFGIWMDFGNQGTRISRNIVYDTEAATLFLEMNHGPAVVDHNIFAGQSVRSNSEATVFAHNLFVDCGYVYHPDLNRKSQYYEPHTTRVVGRKTGTARDDRWYNNIFVRQGLDKVKDAPGYVSDFNLFLEGAKPSSFGDSHSRVDPAPAGFKISDQPMGAVVSFELNGSASGIGGPRVDAGLVGEFPTVGQKIEDRDGRPIVVDSDYHGRKQSPPACGPLSDAASGRNELEWSYEHH